ncbi:FAD-linked oxidase [Skermanella stibiiresistens SB22]|uniref:FAD-linked oxidase n=1 Tax=Skermanella stibiiresistens SB22 TaxID=1385369 RepID=W9GVA1_9PROT|nr:FAD-binding oxidoreductase [Skermanella stibiiresistens]EWY36367.1 FAD-linked oxidase [Skermanella stibiiresistens SB22]
MTWKKMTLTGWGRTRRAEVDACRPERGQTAIGLLKGRYDRGILAHGLGRSYGDAPLNDGGNILLTERLNRMVSFDPSDGTLVCEAGVTFDDLLTAFLPRGFLPPTSPGTAFATIGGAIANDVHGKNHDRVGSFGDHVLWLDLILPTGEMARVSPTERPELFAATIGGVGLTGVILHACFRLRRVFSGSVDVRERRMPDLDAFMASLSEARETAGYSVGWIDGMARGGDMGRGILETAETAATDAPAKPSKARAVPIDLPGFTLNPLSINLFNQAYYRRVSAEGRTRTMPIRQFLYPLDAIHHWNRIYGKRGFHQFQAVIPDAEAVAGMRKLLEAISEARAGSFLAVLKTLGGEGRGLLSFPTRGYTLALDFPRRDGVEDLMARLTAIALDHGGRIYLAKDAVLDAASFARMYPKLGDFRHVLDGIDPDRRIQSDLSRRLDIRGVSP